MSVEILTNEPEVDDWEESGASVGLNGLPEAVEPVKPEGAVEPPHTPVAAQDADDEPPAAGARNERGQFTRHRAQSQRATKDDVETINALTARIKAAEEADGADIPRKDGESDRVYNLRRRAEILERRKTGSAAPSSPQVAPPTSASAAAPTVPSSRPAATHFAPKAFSEPEPNPEDAAKYPDGVYDRKFIADYSTWAAKKTHHELRQADEQERYEHSRLAGFHDSVTAARAKHADFDAIAFGPTRIDANSPIDLFIMEHEHGAEVLYYLNSPANAAEFNSILAKSPLRQVEALSLLAQRLTSSSVPAQVAKTGSTAAPARNSAPRPPNPVRTAPVNASTEPPGDDDSLEAHERFYYPRNRRRD